MRIWVRAAAMRRSLTSTVRKEQTQECDLGNLLTTRHRAAEASCHRHTQALHNQHCAWHLLLRTGCRDESERSDFTLTSRIDKGNTTHRNVQKPPMLLSALLPLIITLSTTFIASKPNTCAGLGVRAASRTGTGCTNSHLRPNPFCLMTTKPATLQTPNTAYPIK
jgi:hypothetical protein